MIANQATTTDVSPRTPPAKFQGWRRRRGGRWWIVSQADTESDCLARLLDVAKQDRTGSCDVVILPTGDEP